MQMECKVSVARSLTGRALMACLCCVVVLATFSYDIVDASPSSAAIDAALHPASARESVDFGPSSATSADLALNGWGDSSGYHLDIGKGSDGFQWQELAVLRPDGIDDSSWTGYQCLSGDGRYVAVAILPASAVNTPSLREDGAFAYTIDVSTGAVHPVASGVALKYYSPGCGTGDSAVFTVSLGANEQTTDLLAVDMTTGAVTQQVQVAGEVSSAVPTATGVVGVLGSRLVQVRPGQSGQGETAPITSVTGQAYDLRPASDGGVDFLTTSLSGSTATVWHETDGSLSQQGSGPRTGLGLFLGRGGHNIASGTTSAVGSALHVVSSAGLPNGADASSLDGNALFAEGSGTSASAERPVALGTSTQVRSQPTVSGSSSVATGISPVVPAGATNPMFSARPGATASTSSAEHPATSSGTVAKGSATARLDSAVTDAAQTPTCAVARLSPTLQVLQPSASQVNWAVQMAEQGLLTGSTYQRPANFDNMGLAAYDPSSDFAPIPLDHPSTSTTTTVPRSVMEAIMAQESNWDQASFHALPGIAGDPEIADYYGAAGGISSIDYAAADCGYGIAQVTDGMAVGDTEYSAHGQMKIAVDYQENIAAGLQILEQTWNQLYTSGIIANNGDPTDLENWYFAAWAYNTGIEPNAAHGNTTGCTPGPTCEGPDGTWGLGWTNNPADPDYPPNRAPYLEDSYADAATPGDWPYQERILGWMESPLRFGSTPDYTPATLNGGETWMQVPAFGSFCSTAGDDCTPPVGVTSGTCTLSDFDCWWHSPVTWIPNCSTTCATSPYTVGAGSTEPAVTDPHPPTCTESPADLPTTANGPPIVVLDDTESSSGVPYNLVGCSTPIASGGTFSMAYGTDSNGDPIGAIDTHQLGAGFGGHILFSHTETGSNSNLINTGTWTPTLPSTQYYQVKVHIPATGAAATDLVYDIYPSASTTPFKIRLNQNQGQDVWLTLGTFGLTSGAKVVLTNQSGMTPGAYDVAYDAVAFVPQGGTIGTVLGGPPTVSDAPAGSNPSWAQCPCTYQTSGDPVDTGTGAYSDTWTDLSTPGRGASLDFTRTYTSATADPTGPNGSLAKNGPFGWGWTYSYGLSAATNTTNGTVTITQEDGSTVVFTDSSGVYTPTEPRDDATLTETGSVYTFTRRNTELFTFNATSGDLTTESDLVGAHASVPYATSFAYNASGQLSTITDPAGRVYTLTWTSGHITKLQDSAGRTVTYAYDSSGDLTDVYGVGTTRSPKLLNNDHTQYTYASTATHLMASIRQPDYYGSSITPTPVTSMTYDTSDRVISQTNAVGATTTFAYGPSSSPSLVAGQTLVTDGAGHETLDTYASGLLASETKGYGTSVAATWSYLYDPLTLGVIVTTDPDGNVTTASYDSNGNKISSSNADGFTTSYSYNAENQLVSSTDPLGVQTTYGYDQSGHVETASGENTGTYTWGDLTSQTSTQLIQSAEIDNGLNEPVVAAPRTTNYYYDSAADPGDRTRVVDPLGNTTTTTYDAYGDLATSTDPLGHETKYGYNTVGWLTSEVSPVGSAAGTATSCTPPAAGCTTYAHDAWGNVIVTTDPLGHTTKAVYDADGNKTSSTDGDGNVTTYTFNPANEETVVTQADGTTVKTAYDADGTVATTKDASGSKTTYSYDAQGRLTTEKNPDGRTTTTGYDLAGRVTTVEDPSGAITTTGYDPAGNVTSTSYSGTTTPDVSTVYDPDGRRISMTDGTGTSTWAYDAFGEITSSTNGAGSTVSYSYDADGHQTGIVYPGSGHAVTDGYNVGGQLTSVTDWNGASTTFGYDPDGDNTTTTYPNGTTVTNGFNTGDQETSTTLTQGTTTLGADTYGRDGAGQVASSTPSGSLPGPAETDTYTPLQQLAATGTAAASKFGYNSADDPTNLGGVTEEFDSAGQLCWSTSATVTSPTCATTPSGATTYTYNTVGERTATTPASGTASSFGYNQAKELTTASTPSGSGTYAYNGDGLRTAKTVSGVTTQFTWGTVAAGGTALLTDGTTSYLYGPDNLPIEQTSTTATSYFVHDDLGSTVALTNSAGSIAGTYSYGPYGQTLAKTGTTTSPLQYGGGYTDPETGLIYLQHRYYDPATAEFLSIDPEVNATGQAYQYAGDNPLNEIDPYGLSWWNPTTWTPKTWETIGVVAGGVALAATGVGALADASIIGGESAVALGTFADATAIGAGGLATGIDGFKCVDNDGAAGLNAGACAGAALGALSLGLGGIGAYGGLSDEASIAFSAGAFNLGLAGTTWDGLSLIAEGAGGTYGSVDVGAAQSAGYGGSQIENTRC